MGIFSFMTKREEPVQAPRPKVDCSYRERAVFIGNENMAMKISTVYSAVDLISSTVAKLPCHYKRYNKAQGVYVDYVQSQLFWSLLRNPNERMTAYTFWKQVVAQMLLTGNAYVYPERKSEKLILITPYCCNHDTVNNIYHINDMYNGISGDFGPNEILHFRNMSIDGGYSGLSVISYAAEALSIQATGDRETLNRFAQGGKFKALYCNDDSVQGFGDYADAALDEGADDIQAKLDSGKDIISVPGNGKIQPLSMSSVDLQYLENRKFGVREICRFFRVPPSKVYDDFSGAYKSTADANVEFLSDSIDPILCNIEQELEKKLLFGAYNSYKFSFDRTKLFTADLAGRAAYQKSTIENGIYTVNDWRRKEDLPPVEGGDRVFISCNVAPIDSVGQPKTEIDANK